MDNGATFRLDLTREPLTPEEREEFRALASQPALDVSNLTLSTEQARPRAQQGPQTLFKAVRKTAMTVKLDADIAGWLYSQDRDYGDELNTILREAMSREIRQR